jgi:hypothetical protein
MIDTYYRIKSLSEAGIHIHLHCFEYGRSHPEELELLCDTVSYYPRKTGFLRLFSLLPYIVLSRKSKLLLDNLLRDDYPVLFDGLHSTYYIDHRVLINRRKYVRMHNIEHKYYQTLAKYESNLFKKIYFLLETLKLKHYERVIGNANCIFPISITDKEYFDHKYHNAVLLPPFHPFNKSENLTGFGKYILYHGDLSVSENATISESLISDVFSKMSYQCIIAGKNPSERILSKAALFSNIKVISNPDNIEMTELILNAHIQLLPALTTNGFKLKLLVALYAGRHCLVNSLVAESTALASLFHVADSSGEIMYKIHLLMKEQFTGEMILDRQKVLGVNYDNQSNSKKLIEIIFTDIDINP